MIDIEQTGQAGVRIQPVSSPGTQDITEPSSSFDLDKVLCLYLLCQCIEIAKMWFGCLAEGRGLLRPTVNQ